MKKTFVLLLKIPFVFVPAFLIWLTFCLLVASIILMMQDTGSGNPFPSLKKTCQWVTEWYVNSAKYLSECVR